MTEEQRISLQILHRLIHADLERLMRMMAKAKAADNSKLKFD